MILAAGTPPDKIAQAEHARANHAIENALTSIANSEATTAKATDTSQQQKPCGPSGNNYSSDLCAQWKAATAAADSAYWAMAAFWVSLVGAVGIVISLLFTWDALRIARNSSKDADAALDIAKRNADAAQQLVEVSQQTAEKQLRAYITIESVTVEDVAHGSTPNFFVMLRNTGMTPASSVLMNSRLQLAVDINPSSFRFYFRKGPSAKVRSKSIVGANQIYGFNYPCPPLPREGWDKFYKGAASFVFAGVFSYRDVFGRRHIGCFKYFLSADEMSKGNKHVLSACERGNAST